MPARSQSDPAAFIARLPLTPLGFRPDILLHRPVASSGLSAWLTRLGRSERPPYWAYAWAGGAALALHLQRHGGELAGRTVLDLGAGSGLVGIAAARAGAARVLALEADPVGRVALGLNARANGTAIEIVDAPVGTDIVLAGDVFYDREVAAQMLPMLRGLASAGATVLVGDPYRRDLPLAALVPLADYMVPDMGGATEVRAGVFRLETTTPPAGGAI